MKVNTMIAKAMVASVAATVMLGSATVMADSNHPDLHDPVIPNFNTLGDSNRPFVPVRPDGLDELRLPYYDSLRNNTEDEQESETPEAEAETETETENTDNQLPEIDLTPAEDESETTSTADTTNNEETPAGDETVTEESDEALFHTGDIILVSNDGTPVTLSDGDYKIYVDGNYYLRFNKITLRIRNRVLLANNIGFGSGYAGVRVVVDDDGTVNLYPITRAQLPQETVTPEASETPEIPQDSEASETPVIPEGNSVDEQPTFERDGEDTTSDSQTPSVSEAIPDNEAPTVNVNLSTGSNTVDPGTSAPAAPAVAPSAPAASSSAPAAGGSAPVTMVAGVSRSGAEGFVDRLYEDALNRNADSTGRAYWINLLSSKAKTGTDVANGFFNSAEFNARDLNNVEFVTTLYRVFFDREPDHNGLNHWVNALNNGASRSQIITGFTSSSEWANTCSGFGIDA